MKKLMTSVVFDALVSAAVVAIWKVVSVDPLRGFLAVAVLSGCAVLLLECHDRVATAQRAQ